MKFKRILGIDPGNVQSAFVVFEDGKVLSKNILPNEELIKLEFSDIDMVAIEMIASYGMSVGQSVFDTCLFVGRLYQRFLGLFKVKLVYRKDIKLHLCNTLRAKDSNIIAAISNRYGGDIRTAKGNKAHPGPLYGIKEDEWSALALCIFCQDEYENIK